jgi:hypothetical protein
MSISFVVPHNNIATYNDVDTRSSASEPVIGGNIVPSEKQMSGVEGAV